MLDIFILLSSHSQKVQNKSASNKILVIIFKQICFLTNFHHPKTVTNTQQPFKAKIFVLG